MFMLYIYFILIIILVILVLALAFSISPLLGWIIIILGLFSLMEFLGGGY